MKVNPHYKNIDLPVDSWPALDTFEPTTIYNLDVNPCLALNPVPIPAVGRGTHDPAQLHRIGDAVLHR